MLEPLIIVLDVGKTLAKLSLWDRSGRLIERRARPNMQGRTGDYIALDAMGIEAWLATTLAEFARLGPIGSIIPVAHGAAAAILRGDALALAPLDYEAPIAAEDRHAYDADRDAFALTGSPALPDGLNLGAQLHRLEMLHPDLFDRGSVILPWAQYWAWLLSGVAASEVTSLGSHTDLWRPGEGWPSALAERRGWAGMLAPLRFAGDVLGTIRPEWAARTGLPVTVKIHCGLHDSNAALLAARGYPEIAGNESTVLSTGTWFVAMRTPAETVTVNVASLPEARDCLVNVDAYGKPVPSARFMGGREIEILTGIDAPRIDSKSDQPELVAAVPRALAPGAMVLPTMAPGFGPFPHGRGRWIAIPAGHAERRAAVSLYAALVADASLDLIGSCGPILVEGRFAAAEVFVRALAALRPDSAIYVANSDNDVSYGALRLLDPSLAPPGPLDRIPPLAVDLTEYKAQWRREAERMEIAA